MRTPDPTEKISKRRFEGRIRAWRRFLHEWDKLETDGTEDFTADVAAEAADACVCANCSKTQYWIVYTFLLALFPGQSAFSFKTIERQRPLRKLQTLWQVMGPCKSRLRRKRRTLKMCTTLLPRLWSRR